QGEPPTGLPGPVNGAPADGTNAPVKLDGQGSTTVPKELSTPVPGQEPPRPADLPSSEATVAPAEVKPPQGDTPAALPPAVGTARSENVAAPSPDRFVGPPRPESAALAEAAKPGNPTQPATDASVGQTGIAAPAHVADAKTPTASPDAGIPTLRVPG